jgi:hypothetical protein
MNLEFNGRGVLRFRPCLSIVHISNAFSGMRNLSSSVTKYIYIYISKTMKHERGVLCRLQRGLNAVNSWRERWNTKFNEGNLRRFLFVQNYTPWWRSTAKRTKLPFANNVTILGFTFDRRMTWRHYTGSTMPSLAYTWIVNSRYTQGTRLLKNDYVQCRHVKL